jgi:hypothetical protein
MKPYAPDWKELHPGVQYSEECDLYYANKRVYCELSARHNGIIGTGHKLKEMLNGTDPDSDT